MISTIDSRDESTWRDRAFLTIDIDWAHDEVVADTADLIEAAGVAATWFVTHDTPVLERLRANPRFELGLHPNFNRLLTGAAPAGTTAATILDDLLAVVPGARTVRSHSVTQSSGLLDLFRGRGLTHDANAFVPWQSGIELRPWTLWNGLERVPYTWEDDVACLYGEAPDAPARVAAGPGLRVFDFHPIHVFLNTEALDRYERTRAHHADPATLLDHRHDGAGARTQLTALLERMRTQEAACGTR